MSAAVGVLTGRVLEEVARERVRQTARHGDQSHLPDGTGFLEGRAWLMEGRAWLMRHSYGLTGYARLARLARAATDAASQVSGDGSITYADVLLEEVFEALAEDDAAALRGELVQVAAVAVQWIETIDRRQLAGPVPVGTTKPIARRGFHGMWDGERWVPVCDVCGDEAAYCDGTRHGAVT